MVYTIYISKVANGYTITQAGAGGGSGPIKDATFVARNQAELFSVVKQMLPEEVDREQCTTPGLGHA